jgi:hypothetical protein
MREGNYKSFSGAQTYLTESIFKRLAHYFEQRQPGQISGGSSTESKQEHQSKNNQAKKLDNMQQSMT